MQNLSVHDDLFLLESFFQNRYSEQISSFQFGFSGFGEP